MQILTEENLDVDYTHIIPMPESLIKEDNLQSISCVTLEHPISRPCGHIFTVNIKPARKKPTYYMDTFPTKLYSIPHKYDVLITMPSSLYIQGEISVVLVGGMSGKKINHKKEAIQVEKMSIAHCSCGKTEIILRLFFTVCSYHYNKKSFIFVVNSTSHVDRSIKCLYKSTFFSTYMRKI